MKKLLTILLILLSTPLFALDLKEQPAVADGFSKLSDDAKQIQFDVEKFKESGETFLYAVSDFHAVCEIDMDRLAAVIADHDNGEKVFSRMVDTIDLNPEDGLDVPHRQRVHNSAKFLGIGQDYIYDTIVNVEKHDGHEFIMSWKMTDCLEGNFEEYEGFWYLCNLDSGDGSPSTYIRLYTETVFNNIIPFQEMVMQMFTKSETKDIFKSLYKASLN